MKDKPLEEVYRLKTEVLAQFERVAEAGLIDLYYGDESGVQREPCLPYGWQFARVKKSGGDLVQKYYFQ